MAEKFLLAPDPIGQLYYDRVLLDGDEPVLFTCLNDKGTPYYCVCIYNVIGAQEWLITRTTGKTMCDLLEDKITMRQAITVRDKIWFAKEYPDGHIEWEYKQVEDFPDEYLPTDGIYMDADEDEFVDELEYFKSMQVLEEMRADFIKRHIPARGLMTGEKRRFGVRKAPILDTVVYNPKHNRATAVRLAKGHRKKVAAKSGTDTAKQKNDTTVVNADLVAKGTR